MTVKRPLILIILIWSLVLNTSLVPLAVAQTPEGPKAPAPYGLEPSGYQPPTKRQQEIAQDLVKALAQLGGQVPSLQEIQFYVQANEKNAQEIITIKRIVDRIKADPNMSKGDAQELMYLLETKIVELNNGNFKNGLMQTLELVGVEPFEKAGLYVPETLKRRQRIMEMRPSLAEIQKRYILPSEAKKVLEGDQAMKNKLTARGFTEAQIGSFMHGVVGFSMGQILDAMRKAIISRNPMQFFAFLQALQSLHMWIDMTVWSSVSAAAGIPIQSFMKTGPSVFGNMSMVLGTLGQHVFNKVYMGKTLTEWSAVHNACDGEGMGNLTREVGKLNFKLGQHSLGKADRKKLEASRAELINLIKPLKAQCDRFTESLFTKLDEMFVDMITYEEHEFKELLNHTTVMMAVVLGVYAIKTSFTWHFIEKNKKLIEDSLSAQEQMTIKNVFGKYYNELGESSSKMGAVKPWYQQRKALKMILLQRSKIQSSLAWAAWFEGKLPGWMTNAIRKINPYAFIRDPIGQMRAASQVAEMGTFRRLFVEKVLRGHHGALALGVGTIGTIEFLWEMEWFGNRVREWSFHSPINIEFMHIGNIKTMIDKEKKAMLESAQRYVKMGDPLAIRDFNAALRKYGETWENYRQTLILNRFNFEYGTFFPSLLEPRERFYKEARYLRWLARGASKSDPDYLLSNIDPHKFANEDINWLLADFSEASSFEADELDLLKVYKVKGNDPSHPLFGAQLGKAWHVRDPKAPKFQMSERERAEIEQLLAAGKEGMAAVQERAISPVAPTPSAISAPSPKPQPTPSEKELKEALAQELSMRGLLAKQGINPANPSIEAVDVYLDKREKDLTREEEALSEKFRRSLRTVAYNVYFYQAPPILVGWAADLQKIPVPFNIKDSLIEELRGLRDIYLELGAILPQTAFTQVLLDAARASKKENADIKLAWETPYLLSSIKDAAGTFSKNLVVTDFRLTQFVSMQDDFYFQVNSLANLGIKSPPLEDLTREKIGLFTPDQRSHFLNQYFVNQVNKALKVFARAEEDVKAILSPIKAPNPEKMVEEIKAAEEEKARLEKGEYPEGVSFESLKGQRKSYRFPVIDKSKYGVEANKGEGGSSNSTKSSPAPTPTTTPVPRWIWN
ncbi:MAG: hypothetical protein IT289_00190 [Oligoflexia bacterium]|nr:hypothetical protein [Oligoflexia bacterium]